MLSIQLARRLSTLARQSHCSTAAAPTGFEQMLPEAIPPYRISADQLADFDKEGMLLIKGVLPQSAVDELSDMADELASLRPGGPFLVHKEEVNGQAQLCRVENFCKHIGRWEEVSNEVQHLVAQLYREPAIMFKDKINTKGPGGGGFFCHQDCTAYAADDLASTHISALVGIDEATRANGCLEVAPGTHKEGIFPNIKGVTDPELEKSWEFRDILIQPGDIALFCSFLPHRSGTNKTDGWRRSAYLTYNKLSEGEHHEAYYAAKAAVFKAGTGGSVSINDDFAGKVVH